MRVTDGDEFREPAAAPPDLRAFLFGRWLPFGARGVQHTHGDLHFTVFPDAGHWTYLVRGRNGAGPARRAAGYRGAWEARYGAFCEAFYDPDDDQWAALQAEAWAEMGLAAPPAAPGPSEAADGPPEPSAGPPEPGDGPGGPGHAGRGEDGVACYRSRLKGTLTLHLTFSRDTMREICLAFPQACLVRVTGDGWAGLRLAPVVGAEDCDFVLRRIRDGLGQVVLREKFIPLLSIRAERFGKVPLAWRAAKGGAFVSEPLAQSLLEGSRGPLPAPWGTGTRAGGPRAAPGDVARHVATMPPGAVPPAPDPVEEATAPETPGPDPAEDPAAPEADDRSLAALLVESLDIVLRRNPELRLVEGPDGRGARLAGPDGRGARLAGPAPSEPREPPRPFH